jgi:SpoVK/Ycf46/Vps4 family AAA+-type ATPase
MMQLNIASPIVAREVLWTYRGVSEESVEKDFFVALDKTVASEIARRLRVSERVWVGREMHLQVGPYTIQARLTNIEPLLATTVNEVTNTITRYREQAKDEGQDVSTFLAEVIRYPNEPLSKIFDTLVGLNETKEDMFRKLTLLINPHFLDRWITNFYTTNPPQVLMQVLHDRYPLIILEGEVGSGKTALARSIGHRLATRLGTEIALFIVNAQVRGSGHVGELTQNISRAFTEAERCQEREQIPVMLLIDEADALAQARGGRQTHHEDDAGVNTLIQRIDRLRGRPMAVIFATNLAQSLDSAILRRAIASYHFDRPTPEQRAEVFRRLLANVDVDERGISQLVELTEPRPLPGFGPTLHHYTYSDLSQRIVPQAVEEAVYAQQLLNIDHLAGACMTISPTPQMQQMS